MAIQLKGVFVASVLLAMGAGACEDSSSSINHAPLVVSQTEGCGDGVLGTGEECDDGNIKSNDGCSAMCRIETAPPNCGDGNKDDDEECDDGNTSNGDGCSVICRIEADAQKCGDGTLDDGEDCDDGNLVSGDGCSATCELESALCGNNTKDEGEACDDGNTISGDGCRADCLSDETCGNKIKDEGEACDDGNTNNGDGCRADCLSNERCGNKVLDEHKGEQCDGEEWCDTLCRDTRQPLPDEDGDTIADENEGKETLLDTDGDTTPDYQDTDSDADTIPDSVESQNNGNTWAKPKDSDGDTVPDYLDLDSDNDTVTDKVEAGAEPAKPVDSDADTIPDYLDSDSDGDGIPDKVEGDTDPDVDGVPNYLDLDSDGDGIPDWAELYGTIFDDADVDGVPNYLDTDSDGDGILDKDERGTGPTDLSDRTWVARDTDADTVADFIDDDSDNDSVKDSVERQFGSDPNNPDTDGDKIPDGVDGVAYFDEAQNKWVATDTDKDGTINAKDSDSDGDTIPDAEEARIVCKKNADGTGSCILNAGKVVFLPERTDLWAKLPDSDSDGVPDFLDFDSDGDGLPDRNEVRCTDGSLSRYLADVDADGYSDPIEFTFGQATSGIGGAKMMCDKNIKVTDATTSDGNKVEFYFEFDPHNGKVTGQDVLTFKPTINSLDVVFNMDTTGSMRGSIDNLKAKIPTVINGVRAAVANSAFGVCAFDDYPIGAPSYYPYGGGDDRPLIVYGAISTDPTTINTNVQKYVLHNGYDGPESGYPSLYAIMTNSALSWNGGSVGPWSVSAPNWGAVGFRAQSLPVIVHITDTTSHDSTSNPYNSSYVYNAPTSTEVYAVAKSKGVRIVTAYQGSTSSDEQQLRDLADQSNAIVPACAFKTPANAWMCGANSCCTVYGAANGEAPQTLGGKANQCRLRFKVGAGDGLSDSVVTGIEALVKYTTFDVRAGYSGNIIPGTSANTQCFLEKVEAKSYIAPPLEPEKSCNPVATPARFAASYNDGFKNFATGTASTARESAQLTFDVNARWSACATGGLKQTSQGQIFEAYIQLYDQTTGVTLGKPRVVAIYVAPYIAPQV